MRKERNPPPLSVGMYVGPATMENSMEAPEKPKTELSYDPAIPLLGIYPEKNMVLKDTCTPIFIAALFTTVKTWKQPKCLLTEKLTQNMWYLCAMEYDSAVKINVFRSFVAI